jgi:hypothetical protein
MPGRYVRIWMAAAGGLMAVVALDGGCRGPGTGWRSGQARAGGSCLCNPRAAVAPLRLGMPRSDIEARFPCAIGILNVTGPGGISDALEVALPNDVVVIVSFDADGRAFSLTVSDPEVQVRPGLGIGTEYAAARSAYRDTRTATVPGYGYMLETRTNVWLGFAACGPTWPDTPAATLQAEWIEFRTDFDQTTGPARPRVSER